MRNGLLDLKSYLSEEFTNRYMGVEPPFSPIGKFVYLRTYSRYLPDEGRRENWLETCKRVVDYSIHLEEEHKILNGIEVDKNALKHEAELMFDNLFNLKTFPSGRALYTSGTYAVEQYPLSSYNCCMTNIEVFDDFAEIFYLLMLGCGVGTKINDNLVAKLPNVHNVEIEHVYIEDYREFFTKEEMEDTKVKHLGDLSIITIGDSKEGWCDALKEFFKLVVEGRTKISIDYSWIRPKGSRLLTFGGTASGHESMQRMFTKIGRVINNANGKLGKLDVLDIATTISENVVSGSIRRSAMIILCDPNDTELIEAKRNLYKCVDGVWMEDEEISNRRMSNNSILFAGKPSYEELEEIMDSIRINGEPGFYNEEVAKMRREDFDGTNPCGEILLHSKSCCNLSTNNVMGCVEDGVLNKEKLFESLRLSTRIGLRVTLKHVELPNWDKQMQKDRIIGVSFTGLMDMFNACNMTYNELTELFKEMKEVVRLESERYCKELEVNAPLWRTTVKPEGSISCLPGVSSGIHFAHSPYFIRRIRINIADPLYKVVKDMGCFNINPEVGSTWENMTTAVIDFPMKSPEGRTKYDVSAIEQLELYKNSMNNWCEQNTSITVHVREHEWEECTDWLYENWNEVIGVTFLSLTEETYPLLPFEQCSKEQYEEMMSVIRPIDENLLVKYDSGDEFDVEDGNVSECAGGHCPIR